jgi:hypothetical protein
LLHFGSNGSTALRLLVALATGAVLAAGAIEVALWATAPGRPPATGAPGAAGSSASAGAGVNERAHAVVRLSPVRLFGRAHVAGRVGPYRTDGHATVTVWRGRKIVDEATVRAARFARTFRVRTPGVYRASVTYSAPGLIAVSDSSRRRTAALPRLAVGSHGSAVRRLEGGLAALDYYLTGVDSYFDQATADAVLAFHKVQGLERASAAGPATWRSLMSPIRPRARSGSAGHHVEVDQTRQVLYTVDDGQITDIVHISTGANGATRDGHWTVYKKGGRGREYYPSYFDGRRAFHIWPEVPAYAASHGCVRLPGWTAEWYWATTPIGTEVHIYH